MQILLPWKYADFHNNSHATKVYPKVQNNCRSILMTGLLSSSLKFRISAYKMPSSKWWDTAITQTESGDSCVTAKPGFLVVQSTKLWQGVKWLLPHQVQFLNRSWAAQPTASFIKNPKVTSVETEGSAVDFSWLVCGQEDPRGLSLSMTGKSTGNFAVCDTMLLVTPTWCLVSK